MLQSYCLQVATERVHLLAKLAMFAPSLSGGGVQRVSLNLAEGLVAEGLEVDMLLLNPDDAQHVPKGAVPITLGHHRAITSVLPLTRYLKQSKPQLLFTATEPVSLAGIWARIFARTKTRIIPIIMNVPSAYQSRRRHRREILYPLMARWFFPHADHVIAIADAIRHDLIQYYKLKPSHITTIYSPVLTPDFDRRKTEQTAHHWVQTKDKPIILTVARFVPAKDIPTLLHAFKKVRHRRDVRLILLGDGPLRTEIEQLVDTLGLNDAVSMPGFVPNLPYMQACDVFVLSSIFEGLPTVLIEALACSRAIVSTDAGGAREILADGQAGTIVAKENPDALAEAILNALDHPVDIRLLREQSTRFEMQRVVKQYRQHFNF